MRVYAYCSSTAPPHLTSQYMDLLLDSRAVQCQKVQSRKHELPFWPGQERKEISHGLLSSSLKGGGSTDSRFMHRACPIGNIRNVVPQRGASQEASQNIDEKKTHVDDMFVHPSME